MPEDPITPVVFRKDKEDGEIIALFPADPATYDGIDCTMYVHNGQHGSANYYATVNSTHPARPHEYAALLEELKRVGYDNLRVYQKATRRHHEQRRQAVRST